MSEKLPDSAFGPHLAHQRIAGQPLLQNCIANLNRPFWQCGSEFLVELNQFLPVLFQCGRVLLRAFGRKIAAPCEEDRDAVGNQTGPGGQRRLGKLFDQNHPLPQKFIGKTFETSEFSPAEKEVLFLCEELHKFLRAAITLPCLHNLH